MTVRLISFIGLCLLITITPGLDIAVVIRSTVKSGRSAGVRTALGCAAGLFVHAGLVEFLGGRCRPNTVLAVAYDLKVLVGKSPRRCARPMCRRS